MKRTFTLFLALLMFASIALANDTVQIISTTGATADTLEIGSKLEIPDLLTMTVTGISRLDELYGIISGPDNDLLVVDVNITNESYEPANLRDNFTASMEFRDKYHWDAIVVSELKQFMLGFWTGHNAEERTIINSIADDWSTKSTLFHNATERYEHEGTIDPVTMTFNLNSKGPDGYWRGWNGVNLTIDKLNYFTRDTDSLQVSVLSSKDFRLIFSIPNVIFDLEEEAKIAIKLFDYEYVFIYKPELK
jgi:hypothetical protein